MSFYIINVRSFVYWVLEGVDIYSILNHNVFVLINYGTQKFLDKGFWIHLEKGTETFSPEIAQN